MVQVVFRLSCFIVGNLLHRDLLWLVVITQSDVDPGPLPAHCQSSAQSMLLQVLCSGTYLYSHQSNNSFVVLHAKLCPQQNTHIF